MTWKKALISLTKNRMISEELKMAGALEGSGINLLKLDRKVTGLYIL